MERPSLPMLQSPGAITQQQYPQRHYSDSMAVDRAAVTVTKDWDLHKNIIFAAVGTWVLGSGTAALRQ